MTPRKGKISRVATVSCQVDGCERTHSAESSVAIETFFHAGWTRRAGPGRSDGVNWRCPNPAIRRTELDNDYY